MPQVCYAVLVDVSTPVCCLSKKP